MANKSDKPLVRNMIIVCAIAMLIFHFAWAGNYFINLGNWFFALVDLLLIALFIYQATGAYKYADDPNKEWKRYVAVGLALVSAIWAAAWSAGLNERVHL